MLITIQDGTCWCSRANASGARDPLLGVNENNEEDNKEVDTCTKQHDIVVDGDQDSCGCG